MEKTLDLRVQKTYLALSTTMLDMMQEMPFEKIRVNDLCDRAMLRKSTFYKHFADKYELLTFMVREAIRRFDAQIPQNVSASTPADYYARLVSLVFDFMRENERLLLKTSHSDSLLQILNILADEITPDLACKLAQDERQGYHLTASPDVMAAFCSGAVVSCIRSWLQHGRPIEEEALKSQITSLLHSIYIAENP
ncbi:MAG: TetR/AcrR family transcriptional regulator C-terminal domain-containing protein [Eubacteriales bacterium]|nr:TetR/AcrR family transcriptional regulator C-terminal domain-containing protein [Eubacteriales bacterium]